jgi:hypothetical protein
MSNPKLHYKPTYHGCLQIGTPPQIAKAEIENARARMAGYGVGGDES